MDYIRLTRAPLLLPVGQSKEYILPKTRITDVLQTDDAIVKVDHEYVETENWDERYTKVTVTSLGSEDERPFREVEVLLSDDADRTYFWHVVVQRSKQSAPSYRRV